MICFTFTVLERAKTLLKYLPHGRFVCNTQFHLLAVLDDALHGLKEGVVMSSETRIVVLHCRAGKADSITGNELLAQVDVRHESFGFDLKRHIIQFSRIEGG